MRYKVVKAFSTTRNTTYKTTHHFSINNQALPYPVLPVIVWNRINNSTFPTNMGFTARRQNPTYVPRSYYNLQQSMNIVHSKLQQAE
eukprot:g10359.t1